MDGKNQMRIVMAIGLALLAGAIVGCHRDAQVDDSSAAPPPADVQPVDAPSRPETDTTAPPADTAEPPAVRPSSDTEPPSVAEGPPHRYHYYPHHEVFYDVAAHRYTWYDKGVWNSGQALPAAIRLDPTKAMIIELPGEHPELSIAAAHRIARGKGLVPGQARGAGGAAPDDAAQAPTKPAMPEPAAPAPSEPAAPQERKSLF